MSSQSVHAIAGRTLRHWTINTREFVGGSERPSRTPAFSEPPDRRQLNRLASKLSGVRSRLALRAR